MPTVFTQDEIDEMEQLIVDEQPPFPCSPDFHEIVSLNADARNSHIYLTLVEMKGKNHDFFLSPVVANHLNTCICQEMLKWRWSDEHSQPMLRGAYEPANSPSPTSKQKRAWANTFMRRLPKSHGKGLFPVVVSVAVSSDQNSLIIALKPMEGEVFAFILNTEVVLRLFLVIGHLILERGWLDHEHKIAPCPYELGGLQ